MFKKLVVPIIIILFGLMVTIIGALFKIQHWPYGSVLLTVGMLFKALGILLIIIKVVIIAKKSK